MENSISTSIYDRLRNEVRRIAVHSGNLIVGDSVMLNPLFRSLRDSFPDSKLDYIGYIQPFVANLVKRVLPFDEFIKLELKKDISSAVIEFFRSIRELRK